MMIQSIFKYFLKKVIFSAKNVYLGVNGLKALARLSFGLTNFIHIKLQLILK